MNAADGAALERFYEELFGWKLNDSGSPGYQLVSTDAGEHAIGGGLGSGQGGTWVTATRRSRTWRKRWPRPRTSARSNVFGLYSSSQEG